MHVALARKYRPRQFRELIGQEHVARALSGAVAKGRVAHGYLFAGPRGVGKTTAARILAMALNCDTRRAGGATPAPGEPCGACVSCERIWSGSTSLDVVEIDAASNRGVDDARDLRERAMYAASAEGRHKVYIVDEAHMLTREAWNALLKILEEPPPGVIFVFATTEPQKISNTAAPVMSRLQRFDFRRVGPQAIATRVRDVIAREGIAADADAVELIARVADGGMRDALSMLDQVTAFGEGGVTVERVRDLLGLVGDEPFAELLDIVAGKRAAEVLPFVAKLVEAGVDLIAFADGAGDVWRAVLAATLGGKPEGVSAHLAAHAARLAAELAAGDVLRILRSLEAAEEPMRRGGNPRLTLEALLVRWAPMDRTVEIAELLAGTGAAPHGRTDQETPRHQEAETPRTGETSSPGDEAPAAEAAMLSGALTLEALQRVWPDVLAAARAEKPMVAAALADTVPVALADNVLRLGLQGTNPMSGEGLARNRAAVEAIIRRATGTAVRVILGAGAAAAPPTQVPPPQRVSVAGAKTERTEALRRKHPALDSAIEALDLELLD